MNLNKKDQLMYGAIAVVAVIVIAVLAIIIVRVSGNRDENVISTETQMGEVETNVVPTEKPAAESTAEPTARPTVPPTMAPVVNPTAKPIAAPTATPTVAPTATPTAKPSSSGGSSGSSSGGSSATPTPTVEPTATPAPEDDGVMTYEEYNAMDVEAQKAYFESFSNVADFFAWYNDAKAKHTQENPPIEIGGDGTINLEEILNGTNGQQ